MKIKKEYDLMYIGTSNGHFLVIDRPGLFKRNIAFSLPEYHSKCRPAGITDSFFVHKNEKQFKGKTYLLINGDDSTSFDQHVSICRAKAFLEDLSFYRFDFYDSVKQKATFRMKASDRVFFIRAIHIDIGSQFQNIMLFSNYNGDSAWYRKCDQDSKLSGIDSSTRRQPKSS